MTDFQLAVQLRYDNLQRFFADYYATLYPRPAKKVFINQGPDSEEDLANLAADRVLFLAVGAGPGLSYDGMCDRVTVRCRWIGRQGDYNDAESFAMKGDLALLAATEIDGVRLNYVTRQAGRPSLISRDSGSRYHFTCSYVSETASGL